MPFEDQRAPSPPPSLTSIRAGRGEKKPNKACRSPTPFYPRSACFTRSLKDLIHLCTGMAPHKQLCTSKSLRLSLSFCLTSSAFSASLSRWTSQRNKEEYFLCLTSLTRMQILEIQLMRTQKMKMTFCRNFCC